MKRRVTGFLMALCSIGLVISCSDSDSYGHRSEEGIVDEFSTAVEKANTCSADEECVVVIPGCPLGCGSVVNKDEKEQIEQLAERLTIEYEARGYGVTARYTF